jgi:Regulator of chromosome condensation (RCC1) repeat
MDRSFSYRHLLLIILLLILTNSALSHGATLQVSSNNVHTVGLKSDGTVVAVGDNSHSACDLSNWTDIQQVAAGYFNTLGLKPDGTVIVGSVTS